MENFIDENSGIPFGKFGKFQRRNRRDEYGQGKTTVKYCSYYMAIFI